MLNDIQLAREQTAWYINPNWFKERKAKYASFPTDIYKREGQMILVLLQNFSITSTDSEDQTLAKLKKKLKPKCKTSVIDSYTENMDNQK